MRRENFRDADAEVVVQDEDFAPRDQSTVDEDIHGIAGQFVEWYDGTFAELEHFFNQELGAPEFDAKIEFYVLQGGNRKVDRCRTVRGAAEILEAERSGLMQIGQRRPGIPFDGESFRELFLGLLQQAIGWWRGRCFGGCRCRPCGSRCRSTGSTAGRAAASRRHQGFDFLGAQQIIVTGHGDGSFVGTLRQTSLK